jgi:hypothetical protein
VSGRVTVREDAMIESNGWLAIRRVCCVALFLCLVTPPSHAAEVRETIGPMTISVPSTWIRNVDAVGNVNFLPDPPGTAPQSQYQFSKVDHGTPSQLDGHRLMWGEIKKNAGIPKHERSGKAGRFEWSETTAQDRTSARELMVRFYSTKEGSTHLCAVVMATSAALFQTRVAALEKVLGAAQFAGGQPRAAAAGAATGTRPPAGDVPIVGSHIKVEVRFGGVGGSSSTTDHILLFANGIAVRTGVINGAIECYVLMPVANLTDLPFNYGRWRENQATNSIDVQWKEGGAWQMKRDGGLLSVDGRKLLKLRPLEEARFNGIYAYRPVGDAPSALALMPDGRFEAQNLIDNMICNSGQPAPKSGRGTYEVRKWTLILRFDDGAAAYLPLHVRNEENLAAVTKFWVKSYEFAPVR